MSGHYEWFDAEYVDVDLLLPGDAVGNDEILPGQVGLCIGNGRDGNWSIILGSAEELLIVAHAILAAAEAVGAEVTR